MPELMIQLTGGGIYGAGAGQPVLIDPSSIYGVVPQSSGGAYIITRAAALGIFGHARGVVVAESATEVLTFMRAAKIAILDRAMMAKLKERSG